MLTILHNYVQSHKAEILAAAGAAGTAANFVPFPFKLIPAGISVGLTLIASGYHVASLISKPSN